MFDLTGKTALVTGSTQGIGFAVAKALSERGAKVFVHGSRSIEKCLEASAQIPGSEAVSVDLSDKDCAERLYEKTGDVDILILNASVQYRRKWDEIPDDEFEKQVQVNYKSSYKLIQKYSRNMCKNKWGRIITVGSVQQHKPHKDMLIYSTTKAALMNMVKSLASQLAPYGVTVNNIAPGVIATPRNEEALADKEYEKKVLSGIPCGYAGEAEDCCGGAVLLCSEEGRYITGNDLIIDGGMHL